ncbi:MAG: hypothetical protein H6702_25180 [Myxococcales bacterium]|nr:hypothetical protein [Myxococcales bacterium]
MFRLIPALALCLAAPAAVAQQDPPAGEAVRVQFYEIPEAVIEGRTTRPSGQLHLADVRPKHARLVRLKHAVLPKLQATRHDGALR